MLGRYVIVILVIAGALVTAVASKSTSPLSWPDGSDARRLKFSRLGLYKVIDTASMVQGLCASSVDDN